jgi:glutamate dehydrogenase/leucine dehydrogenase
VVPDILANAGGVTVSYFEWVQNLNRDHWPLKLVHERLENKMVDAFHEVYNISISKETSMRNSAYIHALNRLGDAHLSLGIFP